MEGPGVAKILIWLIFMQVYTQMYKRVKCTFFPGSTVLALLCIVTSFSVAVAVDNIQRFYEDNLRCTTCRLRCIKDWDKGHHGQYT